jgi:hypothetical protein
VRRRAGGGRNARRLLRRVLATGRAARASQAGVIRAGKQEARLKNLRPAKKDKTHWSVPNRSAARALKNPTALAAGVGDHGRALDRSGRGCGRGTGG